MLKMIIFLLSFLKNVDDCRTVEAVGKVDNVFVVSSLEKVSAF